MTKWDASNPTSSGFRTYLYNKVEEARIPFYQPGPNEDPAEWDAALRAKPAPGFMPALVVGFTGLAERLVAQRRAVAEFNARMHEVLNSVEAMLDRHDLDASVRAVGARRRQAALRERAARLAGRVQVLRNRGYALGPEEDALRDRLQRLERKVEDPKLGARADELWSRLITVREYAVALKEDAQGQGAAVAGGDGPGALDEDTETRLKAILERFDKQLDHLQKELEKVRKEYDDWEEDNKPAGGK